MFKKISQWLLLTVDNTVKALEKFTRWIPHWSIPTEWIPTLSNSHLVNSHLINSTLANSYLVNCHLVIFHHVNLNLEISYPSKKWTRTTNSQKWPAFAIARKFYFWKLNLFSFFASAYFWELTILRNFVGISFNKKSNKTNIFAAWIQFFSFYQYFMKQYA